MDTTKNNPYSLKPHGFAPIQACGTLPNGDFYYCRSRGRTSIQIAKTEEDWKNNNLLFQYTDEFAFRDIYMSYPQEMVDWATPYIAQYLGESPKPDSRTFHKDTPVKLYGTGKGPVSTAYYPNTVEEPFGPVHSNEIVIRITRNDNGELYDRLMFAMTKAGEHKPYQTRPAPGSQSPNQRNEHRLELSTAFRLRDDGNQT